MRTELREEGRETVKEINSENRPADRLHRLRGAIFDLDGTLLDSSWLWEEVDRRFFAHRGMEMPQDYPFAIRHMEFWQMADYTVERFALPDTPQELMREWTESAMLSYAEEVELKEGAKELLHRLRSNGVSLGIATSCYPEMFLPTLRRHGIDGLFDSYTTTKETGQGKVTAAVYLRAAEKLGLPPAECAVFEDILTGLRSARAAGFFTVGVYDVGTVEPPEVIAGECDLYVHSLGELCASIAKTKNENS